MHICENCVAVDTRPGLPFDSDSICFPCKSMKKKIDWSLRRKELDELINNLKNTSLIISNTILGKLGNFHSVTRK